MAVPSSASVIVVNWNDGTYLEACIESLDRAGGYREIIVVDNGSTDGSPERIERRFPDVRVVRAGTNLGFAGANNLGATHATGDVLVLFNSDAFATTGWLSALLGAFLDDGVAVASPKVYRGLPLQTTTLDSAGCDLEYPLGEGPPRGYLQADTGAFDRAADVAYCAGAAFAIRASTYAALGGLDESFFCYAEESDLCWRARLRGLRCVYEPRASVYHVGSANLGARSPRKLFFQTRNRIRMCLQNYSLANALLFVPYEFVHGTCVIGATLVVPGYRALGLAYLRAWAGVLGTLSLTVRTRALRQRERTRSDRDVLRIHKRVNLFATFARYRTFAAANAPSLFNPSARPQG